MKKLYFVLLALLVAGGLHAQCTANFTAMADGDGGYWFSADSVGDSTTLYTWKVWHDSTAIALDSTGREVFYDFSANDTFSICLHVEDTVNACSSDTCFQFIVTEKYVPLLDSINRWVIRNTVCFAIPSENPGSRDICGYGEPHYSLTDELYTTIDTLIDSVQYKVLENFMPALLQPNGTVCLFGYIREDVKERKVYFRDKELGEEIVLYDFALKPGDSICLNFFPQAWQGYYDTGYYHLQKIQEVNVAAGKRRGYYLKPAHSTHQGMVWIEGVGFIGHPIFPYIMNSWSYCGGLGCYDQGPDAITPNNFITLVSCYSHKNWVYFDTCSYQQALQYQGGCFQVFDSCTYGPTCGAINDIAALASFEISPNPASNVATAYLQVKQSEDFSLEVQDLQGKLALPLVKLGRLHEGAQQYNLDVQALPSGTYLVACRTAQGALYRKLVIAR